MMAGMKGSGVVHRERADLREMTLNRKAAGITKSGAAVEHQARRLMDLIPQDTRTLTARMFGDPLPGRSALDTRHPA